jgi:two-component system cell cycle sensor histidine kinase/response regulator CckA
MGPKISEKRTGTPPTGQAQAPSAPAGLQPAETTILIADSEEEIRHIVASTLRKKRYQILETADGEAALAAAQKHKGDIHLLLTDIVLPNLGGLDLTRQLRESRPELKVLFISGYPRKYLLDARDDAFLAKPFPPEILLERVKRILEGIPENISSRDGPAEV